jgi:hypothetical protein
MYNEEVCKPFEREVERLQASLALLEQRIVHLEHRVSVGKWKVPLKRPVALLAPPGIHV